MSCLAELVPPSPPAGRAESCWRCAAVLLRCGEVLETIDTFLISTIGGWVSLQLLICGTQFSLFSAVVDVWKKIERCFIPLAPKNLLNVSKSGCCAREGGCKRLFFERESAQKEVSLKLNLGGGWLASRL